MTAIRVLLVDDIDKNSDVVKETLDMDLQDVGIYAEWKVAKDANEGRRVTREAATIGEPIDVAIVDLYLRDNADQDGAAVIRDVRNCNDKAYVLLVTARPDLDPGFRDRFNLLANHALTYAEIGESASWRWCDLAADIKRHLIGVGRIDVGGVNYDRADVGVVSILEDVGRRMAPSGGHEQGARALRLLGFRCLEGLVSEAADVDISFLAAGRSGASVCRLDVSGGGEPSQAFVLKFGFDRGALESELAANKAASRVLDQTSLMGIVGELQSHERGFHAITARIANRAIPLRRWLVEDASVDRARIMAEVVLLEQLEPFYKEDGRSESKAAEWIRLSPGRKLRALAAIDRFKDALVDPRAGKLPADNGAAVNLTRFVKEEFEENFNKSLGRKVLYVRVFGDLHSENILVQPSVAPRPVLIDASLYGSGHWCSDNARLLVDLLLRARRPGVEAMLWPTKSIIEAEMPLLCPYCKISENRSEWDEKPIDAFMARAVELLPESTHMADLAIQSMEWHWEWHLGLARELVRQATYEDLTPPRACLALAAADEHLQIAREFAAASEPHSSVS